MREEHIDTIKRALSIANIKARTKKLNCTDKVMRNLYEEEIAEYEEAFIAIERLETKESY